MYCVLQAFSWSKHRSIHSKFLGLPQQLLTVFCCKFNGRSISQTQKVADELLQKETSKLRRPSASFESHSNCRSSQGVESTAGLMDRTGDCPRGVRFFGRVSRGNYDIFVGARMAFILRHDHCGRVQTVVVWRRHRVQRGRHGDGCTENWCPNKSVEENRRRLFGSCEAFRCLLNVRGKEVLYIGDHIFGDVLRSKTKNTAQFGFVFCEWFVNYAFSSADSFGLIHHWYANSLNTWGSLSQSNNSAFIKVGALLANGIVFSGIQDEVDPAYALLTAELMGKDLPLRVAATFGLGLAYANSKRDAARPGTRALSHSCQGGHGRHVLNDPEPGATPEVKALAALSLGLVAGAQPLATGGALCSANTSNTTNNNCRAEDRHPGTGPGAGVAGGTGAPNSSIAAASTAAATGAEMAAAQQRCFRKKGDVGGGGGGGRKPPGAGGLSDSDAAEHGAARADFFAYFMSLMRSNSAESGADSPVLEYTALRNVAFVAVLEHGIGIGDGDGTDEVANDDEETPMEVDGIRAKPNTSHVRKLRRFYRRSSSISYPTLSTAEQHFALPVGPTHHNLLVQHC
ncbi:hypothetical protein niasHT_029158 [Heterodera trifolii]|uniref:Uncharacterized protein n=1 Tax=Heterodera trifolii TaxID=157864 RepID=A0ABD2JYD8_9BILA